MQKPCQKEMCFQQVRVAEVFLQNGQKTSPDFSLGLIFPPVRFQRLQVLPRAWRTCLNPAPTSTNHREMKHHLQQPEGDLGVGSWIRRENYAGDAGPE